MQGDVFVTLSGIKKKNHKIKNPKNMNPKGKKIYEFDYIKIYNLQSMTMDKGNSQMTY